MTLKEGYSIGLERGDQNYPELAPLYRQHYKEMRDRLMGEGIEIGEYRPRLEAYMPACQTGGMLNFVVRFHGEPVGYSNIYLTHDMHNGEFIAQEDTIYVLPEHRNGTGKTLSRAVLDYLQSIGVKRLMITATTDTRANVLYRRMGFKPVAETMIYHFNQPDVVRN